MVPKRVLGGRALRSRCQSWGSLLLCASGLIGVAQAQSRPAVHAIPGAAAEASAAERSLEAWLLRLHEASRRRAYTGTFVVSSASGMLSSARIWHVCDGRQQMERVESLTGAPRTTIRRDDEVITFLPDAKVARTGRRESMGLFPSLITSGDHAVADFYAARQQGSERVAGFDADVVQLQPKDRLRFGYRIWSEKKTGLVVKLQTLDAEGRVLEQAAFSELQLDAPVKMDQLAKMMGQTEGYRVEKTEPVKTTPAAEGWSLKAEVPGFHSMNCYRRPATEPTASVVQWVFSDGLASVSLFVQPFDRQRHVQEGLLAMGATHTLTRRISVQGGDWWLTAVGEVPAQTLKAFAQQLERVK